MIRAIRYVIQIAPTTKNVTYILSPETTYKQYKPRANYINNFWVIDKNVIWYDVIHVIQNMIRMAPQSNVFDYFMTWAMP